MDRLRARRRRKGGALQGSPLLARGMGARRRPGRPGRDPRGARRESRVPELLPIRYGRMSVSPFTFYRGAAAVMAADLAGTPTSGLRVQACGDAHLSNFGVFAAPDRRLVFDLNDFDETLPGPWEWDLKRLAASFEIAGRENGFKRKQRRRRCWRPLGAPYREAMRGFAEMRNLEVWYARLDEDAIREQLRSAGQKAVRRKPRRAAPRPAPRTACGRWASSPSGSTASCGSSADRR